MISVGVKPIIFVLNNKGYTIERAMHGTSKKYDDITNWYSPFSFAHQQCCLTQYRNWTTLLETFGGINGETSQSYTVHTKAELDNLLQDEAFARTEMIQLVEVVMEQLDIPLALRLFRNLIKTRVKARAPIAQGKSTA